MQLKSEAIAVIIDSFPEKELKEYEARYATELENLGKLGIEGFDIDLPNSHLMALLAKSIPDLAKGLGVECSNRAAVIDPSP